jgi:hypothetical protein
MAWFLLMKANRILPHRLMKNLPLIRSTGTQFIVLCLLSCFWYLHWRLDTFNEIHPVFSRILYGAEVFGFVIALLNVFMTWRLSLRSAPPPAEGLKVDVFIPTYNEDVEMVRRTALAARAMDYPHQTWILDDGARQAMRDMAMSLVALPGAATMPTPRPATSITPCRTAMPISSSPSTPTTPRRGFPAQDAGLLRRREGRVRADAAGFLQPGPSRTAPTPPAGSPGRNSHCSSG